MAVFSTPRQVQSVLMQRWVVTRQIVILPAGKSEIFSGVVLARAVMSY